MHLLHLGGLPYISLCKHLEKEPEKTNKLVVFFKPILLWNIYFFFYCSVFLYFHTDRWIIWVGTAWISGWNCKNAYRSLSSTQPCDVFNITGCSCWKSHHPPHPPLKTVPPLPQFWVLIHHLFSDSCRKIHFSNWRMGFSSLSPLFQHPS